MGNVSSPPNWNIFPVSLVSSHICCTKRMSLVLNLVLKVILHLCGFGRFVVFLDVCVVFKSYGHFPDHSSTT